MVCCVKQTKKQLKRDMKMKKYVIAMAMLLTLAMGETAAQGRSAKAGEELVDTTRGNTGVEAYSDTTLAVDESTTVSSNHRIVGYVSGGQMMNDIFGNIGMEGMMGMTFVLMVIVIIFVIAPVIILSLLFFFIYKNRKQKMRMAEMAMKQGQPIPDELLTDHRETDEELWQKGLRQTFLGVGLLAFFGYVGSTLGIGIGILVTAVGLGKLAIVKTSRH